MNNIFHKICVSIIVIIAASNAHAFDFESNGLYYNIIDNNAKSVEVTHKLYSRLTYKGDIVVPETVDYSGTTYTVTAIGWQAFREAKITSIILPKTITKIDYQAFYLCSTLKGHLEIPNSVSTIGLSAFYCCTGLTSITLPTSLTTLSDYAFFECSGLTGELIIPDKTTTIGQYAFYRCENLEKLTLSDSLESIGQYAFFCCNKITGDLTFHDSIKSIGNYAFYDCTGFNGSLRLSNSIVQIGDYTFSGCSGFKGELVLPNNLKYIGNYAFYNCQGFYGLLILPDYLTTIGEQAFRGCINITHVSIPIAVSSIGKQAFAYCTNLNSVSFNASRCLTMGTADEPVFKGCKFDILSFGPQVGSIPDNSFLSAKLSDVITHAITVPTASNTSFSSDISATLHVPDKNSLEDYWNAPIWQNFKRFSVIDTIAESFSLSPESTHIALGATTEIIPIFSPANTSFQRLIWASSNPEVAFVDKNGCVTAKSFGETTITAYTIDGSNLSASCSVNVKGTTLVDSIALNHSQAKLNKYDRLDLSCTIFPESATNKSVTWESSDTTIVIVRQNPDNNASILAINDGVAHISATSTDGTNVTATCVVIVGIDNIDNIQSDKPASEISRYDIHGRKLPRPMPGINIIKMSDGTIRKEYVK